MFWAHNLSSTNNQELLHYEERFPCSNSNAFSWLSEPWSRAVLTGFYIGFVSDRFWFQLKPGHWLKLAIQSRFIFCTCAEIMRRDFVDPILIFGTGSRNKQIISTNSYYTARTRRVDQYYSLSYNKKFKSVCSVDVMQVLTRYHQFFLFSVRTSCKK